MKLGAWLWGLGLALAVIASGAGWLVRISPVLVSVPAALFAVGAGSLCIGRPGLMTTSRILSCLFAALLAVVATTNLPLRALFLASKVKLELAAAQAASGHPHTGLTAGYFDVCSSQVIADGAVCLWTTASRDERIGFIKTGAPSAPGALQEIDLGDGWRYARFKGE